MRLKAEIAFIVDSADFKWESFSPVSHIPIVAPEHLYKNLIETVIIMAPGYADEITQCICTYSPQTKHILSIKDGKVIKVKG